MVISRRDVEGACAESSCVFNSAANGVRIVVSVSQYGRVLLQRRTQMVRRNKMSRRLHDTRDFDSSTIHVLESLLGLRVIPIDSRQLRRNQSMFRQHRNEQLLYGKSTSQLRVCVSGETHAGAQRRPVERSER